MTWILICEVYGALSWCYESIKVDINAFIFRRYDSLTGVPSSQRTVAFEKASVLFNIGALYTQIGTRQDRTRPAGLDTAVDNYLRAAGTFQVLKSSLKCHQKHLHSFTNSILDLVPHNSQAMWSCTVAWFVLKGFEWISLKLCFEFRMTHYKSVLCKCANSQKAWCFSPSM